MNTKKLKPPPTSDVADGNPIVQSAPQPEAPLTTNIVPIGQLPVAQLTTLQKVKISHDLATALENEALMDILKKMKSGDVIYEICKAAIEEKIETLMTGTKLEVRLSDAEVRVESICNMIDATQAQMIESFKVLLNQSVQGMRAVNKSSVAGAATNPPQNRPRPPTRRSLGVSAEDAARLNEHFEDDTAHLENAIGGMY